MTPQETIRVLVVDDHMMVREGIASLLEAYPDLKLVGEAKNGREAVTLCNDLRPDVVLMDLVMPEMDGVEATKEITQTHKQVHVLALTSYVDKKLVKNTLEAGAIGYLLKNVTADELAQAIRSASRAEPTLALEATQSLLQAISQSKSDYGLTKREKEVLQLIMRGETNEQIAQSLSITLSTVKNHVSSILTKLGVSSRTAASYKAMKEKIAGK